MHKRPLRLGDVHLDDLASPKHELLADVPQADFGFGAFDAGLM
jgi:hypothetical protein